MRRARTLVMSRGVKVDIVMVMWRECSLCCACTALMWIWMWTLLFVLWPCSSHSCHENNCQHMVTGHLATVHQWNSLRHHTRHGRHLPTIEWLTCPPTHISSLSISPINSPHDACHCHIPSSSAFCYFHTCLPLQNHDPLSSSFLFLLCVFSIHLLLVTLLLSFRPVYTFHSYLKH